MNTFRTTEDCGPNAEFYREYTNANRSARYQGADADADALMQHWRGGHADGFAEGYWEAMRYTGGLCIVAAGAAVVVTLVVLGWLS